MLSNVYPTYKYLFFRFVLKIFIATTRYVNVMGHILGRRFRYTKSVINLINERI